MALFSWIIRCIIVVSLRTNTADSTASSSDTAVNGNGCTFIHHGKLFNLESLRETDGKKPRFTEPSKKYDQKWSYAYNPCTPFKMGHPGPTKDNGCQEDVAICLWAPEQHESYTTIGTQSTVQFEVDEDGNPQLAYESRLHDKRKSIVKLNCDLSKEKEDEALFEVIDDDKWVFRLSHKCACADGCPLASEMTPVVSATVGVILLILVALLFYRWRRRRREAEERAREERALEERARLLDQPNNRFDPPNDIDAQRNDLPNLQNNGGRNYANLSQPVPLSSSCSDITEPAKDKYSNNRATGKSV